MKQCLVCDAAVETFLNLGRMPRGNGFLRPDQFASEFFFELSAGLCAGCGMVQVRNPVSPERMFHADYPFYTSTSARMSEHFRRLAGELRQWCRSASPFVVDIGSNDGTFLSPFAAAGIRHLGIEPAANVARAAVERGVRTLSQFMNETLAREVVAENGQADIVFSANVLSHIPDLHSVFAGIKLLLKPQGVLVFEDPYLADIVAKTAYDQIYDEHIYYFGAGAISRLLAQHGLELIDLIPQPVHGGSMRYWVGHRGAYPPAGSVAERLAREDELKLGRLETFERFRERVERSRQALRELLEKLKAQSKRVVGYAATAKSATVLNYCGLGPDLISCLYDKTPVKQGKYSPGAHLPVRPDREFANPYPDYALLFAWNHAEEIFAKEGAFREAGGRWIVFVPEVRILD
jgi:methylation protein EvaC